MMAIILRIIEFLSGKLGSHLWAAMVYQFMWSIIKNAYMSYCSLGEGNVFPFFVFQWNSSALIYMHVEILGPPSEEFDERCANSPFKITEPYLLCCIVSHMHMHVCMS